MKHSWIIFMAERYMMVKRKTSGIGSAMLAVLGVSVGVMSLITVLSVMNGFQLSFIEDILEISSYHLRVIPDGETPGDEVLKKISETEGVKSLVPFIDIQTLCRGGGSQYTPSLLRAVSHETAVKDPSLINQLNIERGEFDLKGPGKIVIGYETAYKLAADVGDSISVVSMAGSSFSLLSPESVDLTVTGIFNSGYYEFDSAMMFVSMEGIEKITENMRFVYGIKLEDPYSDAVVMDKIIKNADMEGLSIISWREYNSGFFGALRMEKNAMMILIGLIFLVVGVNIYHSQKRNVIERQEEIGIIRTLGATPVEARQIFLIEGMLIGLAGAFTGTAAGLLVAQNIQFIFFMGETIGNIGVDLLNGLIRVTGLGIPLILPMTRAFFYLPEVPVRILPGEVFLIFMFAFFSSVAAAYFAGRRVSEVNPASVLRYE